MVITPQKTFIFVRNEYENSRPNPNYCNSLYHNIALMDILKLQNVQGQLPGLLVSLTQCLKSLHWHPIAILLRVVQLPIKHFHRSNQHIYIHFSLLQDIFDHLILIYFFPSVKINVGTRAITVAAPTLELTLC